MAKFILNIEEGKTNCSNCPFGTENLLYKDGYACNIAATNALNIDCRKYDFSTIKVTENTNPTWEHVTNAFEAGKKWERTTIVGEIRLWLKHNTNWDQEYDEGGRNENYGKIDELINAILERKL